VARVDDEHRMLIVGESVLKTIVVNPR